MDDQRFIELIKQHLDFEITKSYDDYENTDFKVYSETTADGYEVFVVTYDSRNVSVCEDVYYYDHDLARAIKQEINGGMVVYIEEYLYDDIRFDDELVELFVEKVDDIYSEREELELTKEEIKFLEDEYGVKEEEEEKETEVA